MKFELDIQAFVAFCVLQFVSGTDYSKYCIIPDCPAALPGSVSDGSCIRFQLMTGKKSGLCCKHHKGRVSFKKTFVPSRTYILCDGSCSHPPTSNIESCMKCMGCPKKQPTTPPPPTTTTTMNKSVSDELRELRADQESSRTIIGILAALLGIFVLIAAISFMFIMRGRKTTNGNADEMNVLCPEDDLRPQKQFMHRCGVNVNKEVVTNGDNGHTCSEGRSETIVIAEETSETSRPSTGHYEELDLDIPESRL